MKNKGLCAALLILILLCSVVFALAEETQTVFVENTPVKGMILLDKKGKLLTEEGKIRTGYLKGAVFEIRAAEDITGKDGTKWYEKGELAETITTSGEGMDQSKQLPLGKYEIKEIQAPSGYILDQTVYTAELRAVDHETPVVTATITSFNDPIQFMIMKTDPEGKPLAGATFALFNTEGEQIAVSISDDEGLARFNFVPHGTYLLKETKAPEGYLLSKTEIPISVDQNWKNSDQSLATVTNQEKKITFIKTNTAGQPMSAISFCLVNADTKKIAETVVSDQDGVFTFTKFDYGTWKVREMNTPEGYCALDEYSFTVSEDWKAGDPILCVNIPNHYEFQKTDSSGKPLKGVQFVLEDSSGKTLMELTSDEDGMVRIESLVPGTYFIKETKTLEGFTLSGDVKKLVIDENYMISEKLPTWINYTTIQTGVNIAVTWTMWVGLGIMVISGTMGLVRKRRSKKT